MIVDCHTHFNNFDAYDAMMTDTQNTGAGQFAILVFEKLTAEPDNFKLPHGLWFKLRHPDRVYLFGGLDLTGTGQPEFPLVTQLEALMAAGCDGLKFLHGKPDRRKCLGHALNSPIFDALFDRLEQTQFPVLWHVGDPPEFWHPDQVPLWAKKNRWWYDETHPGKAQIDAEIADVFEKHPRLNLILPHFFFLSNDLDRAAALLARYPSFVLDLAPGVEMYHNFTRQHRRARDFFIAHADRILFGTDIGIGRHETGPKRGWMIRQWLETTETFPVPDDPFMTPDERPDLKGIGLSPDVLEKIYSANFHRVLGRKHPKPLNTGAVKALLNELEIRAVNSGEGPSTAGRVLREI